MMAWLLPEFLHAALPRHFGHGFYTFAGPAFEPLIIGAAIQIVKDRRWQVTLRHTAKVHNIVAVSDFHALRLSCIDAYEAWPVACMHWGNYLEP